MDRFNNNSKCYVVAVDNRSYAQLLWRSKFVERNMAHLAKYRFFCVHRRACLDFLYWDVSSDILISYYVFVVLRKCKLCKLALLVDFVVVLICFASSRTFLCRYQHNFNNRQVFNSDNCNWVFSECVGGILPKHYPNMVLGSLLQSDQRLK